MDIGRTEPETNATTPLVVPRALIDFDVIATDGKAGRVHRDSANDESHLVVQTRKFPARKRLIPTSTVSRISWGGRQVFVQMSKNQVKSAPDTHHESWLTSSDDWGGHASSDATRDYDGLLRR